MSWSDLKWSQKVVHRYNNTTILNLHEHFFTILLYIVAYYKLLKQRTEMNGEGSPLSRGSMEVSIFHVEVASGHSL